MKADGVVYYTLQYCHSFNVEYVNVKNALEQAKIPVIHIESDYSESDSGHLKNRLEAFMEML